MHHTSIVYLFYNDGYNIAEVDPVRWKVEHQESIVGQSEQQNNRPYNQLVGMPGAVPSIGTRVMMSDDSGCCCHICHDLARTKNDW